MTYKHVFAAGLAAAVLTGQAAVPSGSSATIDAVRSRIKHVFVIYQENHSFDEYFGTYPGADNLASAAAASHGFRQYDPMGKTWITPFRMTDPDIESPSQARRVLEAKIDGGKMDAFVSAQERVSLEKYAGNQQAARDVGIGTMGFYDCDTLPFLWKYAKTFALFDRVFETMMGPSTPNNIAVIAAQAGETQAARNPSQRVDAADKGVGVPVVNDKDPAYGPYTELSRVKQIPQTYATLMLTLAGTDDTRVTQDTAGVARDLGAVVVAGRAPVPWGWYQEGYVSSTMALPGYETHHNGPQYFGYLRNNDVYWDNVRGTQALLQSLSSGSLPDRGIFYVKGASQTEFGWKPANPDPYVQSHYRGDDDHPGPGDSDHQIGESFVATFVNAVARSPYWNDSVIIVAWDDPGGFYDHVPPPQFENCPDAHPCGDGPRIPFLVISPYARSGAIVHDAGDTSSIVKFADELFDLPALASLPDERPYMPQGPRDANPAITDLLGAFDPARLSGSVPPIPATDAEIPDAIVNTFPPKMNCASLGITPVALPNAPSTPPPGYTPRASIHPSDD
ncbi:MAG TPA: alkaline phosphatase family protein [Candidatus Baltobacteraceae bacterium]|nr:alkaline phosphatase family protein [Candidatus Baltobacteraceae bacterium]